MAKLVTGSKTVGAPGTRERLVAATANAQAEAVVIVAKPGNTGLVYVGNDGVTSGNTPPLYPGDQLRIEAEEPFNLSDVWLDVSVSGEGVDYIATPQRSGRTSLQRHAARLVGAGNLTRATAGGSLNVAAAAPGASEVKTQFVSSVAPFSTRATAITPTAGKKVRVLGVIFSSESATLSNFELYFGTGANWGTNATKGIFYHKVDNTVNGGKAMVFPDGAGPVGAVDEVVSFRTGVDLLANANVTVFYREE